MIEPPQMLIECITNGHETEAGFHHPPLQGILIRCVSCNVEYDAKEVVLLE